MKTYSDRYWEMFNEINGDFDNEVVRIFKVGLPAEHGLRRSLIRKPVISVCQLMDRIDKYKRVEEDQQQVGKGRVSGRTNTTTVDPARISEGNLDLHQPKPLTHYSENPYIRFLKKSRMSHTLCGQAK